MNDHETPESAADPSSAAPPPEFPRKVTKPGWRTSEFWVTGSALAIIVFNAMAERLSGPAAAGFALAATVVYNLSRFVVKVSNNVSPEEVAQEFKRLHDEGGRKEGK